MKRSLIIGIFIFLFINTIIAGSDFLLINNSPESSGKGNAGVAEYSDVSYSLINPASTVKNIKPQVSFTYLILNNDLNYNYFGAGYPLSTGMLSVHLIYVSLPDSSETFGGEEKGEGINFSDVGIIISDSFKIGDIVNAGLSFKYIKCEISDFKDSTYAFDFGLIKEFNFFNFAKKYYNNLNIGSSVKNFGGKMKFIEQEEELPLTYTFGIKYSPYVNMSFLYDLNKTINKDMDHFFGFEYKTPYYFIPRIGVKFEEETVLMSGIGIQYGLDFMKFKCDYSYNLLGQVVKNHSFSLNFEILVL